MSFFTIFTVIKILAKFGTTRKMLNASLLWSYGGCFFKDCLRIFVMFANVDIGKIVLLRVQILQLFLLSY